MSSGADGIREEIGDDGTRTWTLCNEARRNAVAPAALRWIARRCADLAGDIVVLTGAGDRAFCAGFDLKALTQTDEEFPDAPLIAASDAMTRADATFVAAIGGYAIGAGVELVSACDIRVASREAWFKVPANTLGVVYHAAGLRRFRAAFGPTVTDRLVLLGETVDASTAFERGGLHAVAEPADFAGVVAEVVGRLRAASPAALRGNRNLLRALAQDRLAEHAATHQRAREAAYAALRVLSSPPHGDP